MVEWGAARVLDTRTRLARDQRRGGIPDAPARALRRLPWQRAELLAVHSCPVEDSGAPCTQLAWLPVEEGRIDMCGARDVKIVGSGSTPSKEEAPARALSRRFLIAWSAEDLVPFLEGLFGGGAKPWFRRTIDVQQLATEADQLAGDELGPSGPDRSDRSDSSDLPYLASVARRFRVPGPPPRDAMDAALMTAELFLVLATRLAAQGYRDVGSLLARTKSSPLRMV